MRNFATKKDMKFGNLAPFEKSVSQFIPYTRLVDENTIKTNEGYLIQVIKLEGIPFETALTSELNHKKEIRASMLKGISNSRFALYHHIIRRQINKTDEGVFSDKWCHKLNEAYIDRLSRKKMFVNEQYLTIVRRPAQSKIGLFSQTFRNFSGKFDANIRKSMEDNAHKALNDATRNIIKAMEPYKPELLGLYNINGNTCSQILSFLSYLINFEHRDVRLPYMSISDYLPAKRISFGHESFELRGVAQQDTKLGGILSIKEYANATAPGMLDGLLRLPHEFVLSQSFGFVDRQTSLDAINEASRKMIASDSGAESLIDDLENAKNELSSGMTSFGEHHLSITVLGNNRQELEQALSECNSSLVNLGIIATREDINLEPAFWANLPGNFSYIARRSLISSRNFASFAGFHNFPAGKKSGNHWGKAITKLETTSGTPYWFNFHENDVGNFTLIGPTGTGKTVLLTFLLAQAQKLSPTCIYFDKDRGAELFIRAIGGEYNIITAGRPSGLNPLQLDDTPESRVFLHEWLKILIESDGGNKLSPNENNILIDAIKANFDAPIQNRKLSFLSELLGGYSKQSDYTLSKRIEKWHGEGDKAWLFDNETDSLSLNNLTLGFDLTSILDDPVSRTPWLMYIFHRINNLLDGRKTIIVLDEGWKMLDDPVFSARIKDWMKTVRKQNGLIGFATQSARDALGSLVGEAIIEQSPTGIFLPNASAKEEDYCKGFGLSPHELKIIRSLSPESRCFLLKQGSNSVIAKLDLSDMKEFTEILSGRTQSIKIAEELIAKYGSAPDNWLPHFYNKVVTT